MSIRERVIAELKRNPGKKYCNSCLRVISGANYEQLLSEVTRHLGRGPRALELGFCRRTGFCGNCGQQRIVIWEGA